MLKRFRRVFVSTMILPLATAVFAASEDQTSSGADASRTGAPAPLDVAAPNTPPAGMSLKLYRSLRAKWKGLIETELTEADKEQPGADPAQTAKDVQDLRAEVEAHYSEIFNGLASPLAFQRELAAGVLALAHDRQGVVSALCVTLKTDSDSAVRAATAHSLGYLGDARAAEALLSALEDEDETVRLNSAAALGRLRDERAVKALLRVLRNDARPQTRGQAALSLGQIKRGVRANELMEALKTEADERVRMAIAASARAVSGAHTEALAAVPPPDEYQGRLAKLSRNMRAVELKLRDDRHDESVQLEEGQVERQLDELIRTLQEMGAPQAQGQAAPQNGNKIGERRLQALAGKNGPPAQGLGGGAKAREEGAEALTPRTVEARADGWANLPPKERDELLQVMRPEIPLRWRKRLEAYFVSIAVEAAQQR